MRAYLSQNDTAFMALETRLDRIQCLLRKAGKADSPYDATRFITRAYRDAKRALGECRSAMGYNKIRPQPTILNFIACKNNHWTPRALQRSQEAAKR